MQRLPEAHDILLRDGPVDDFTVAVTVTVHNYAHFLTACLDSVAAQSYPNLELVVVDDASQKDASCALAEAWLKAHADRFLRVLLVRHTHNEGLAAARNTAFARSRSRSVFVLDADNSLFPTALAKLQRALEGSGLGAAYAQLVHFDGATGLGLADIWHPAFFARGNYVDAMALIRRETWAQVGGYAPLSGWEDYDFWCKCIEAGIEAVFVPELLCRYRVHQDSMLRTETESMYASLRVALLLRHPWLRLFP